MKFLIFWNLNEISNFFVFSNKAALNVAVEKGNLETVRLLLSHPEINVNIKSISNNLKFFNSISKKKKFFFIVFEKNCFFLNEISKLDCF